MKIDSLDFRVDGSVVRVARLSDDKFESPEDPGAAIGALRSCGVRIDLFTFMQTLPHTSPRYDYAMDVDNVAAMRVSTFDRWWAEQINAKTRNVVRKAERAGVLTREVPFDDDLVAGMSRVYNESRVRQGKRFPHFGKDVHTVRAETGTFPERSIFLGAFLGGDLIGFAKLVVDRDGKQARFMQILSMLEHRDKAPTNALIARAVQTCADRHIDYLVYASFAYGNKQRDGLSDFKRHNGFRRIDVPRYFVPLTRVGAAAFALRLHRPLIHRLPGPVLAGLREVRGRWYERRFGPAKPHM